VFYKSGCNPIHDTFFLIFFLSRISTEPWMKKGMGE
jgi:hypothetical protein